jgi:putative oxidoreductase
MLTFDRRTIMNTRLATQELLAPATPNIASRALRALTATSGGISPTVLRLALGLVMFPHGAQKLLGWFGGFGFSATMSFLTQNAGLPAGLALLVIIAEFFGSLALILGLFSRAAAVGIAAVMVGAIATVHLPNGFFMNWTGQQAGEGFEYHLLVIGMVLAILIQGSGRYSLDRQLARGRR